MQQSEQSDEQTTKRRLLIFVVPIPEGQSSKKEGRRGVQHRKAQSTTKNNRWDGNAQVGGVMIYLVGFPKRRKAARKEKSSRTKGKGRTLQ